MDIETEIYTPHQPKTFHVQSIDRTSFLVSLIYLLAVILLFYFTTCGIENPKISVRLPSPFSNILPIASESLSSQRYKVNGPNRNENNTPRSYWHQFILVVGYCGSRGYSLRDINDQLTIKNSCQVLSGLSKLYHIVILCLPVADLQSQEPAGSPKSHDK